MRALLVPLLVGASLLAAGPMSIARTAACPCSPCRCAPCPCGGGGSHGNASNEQNSAKSHEPTSSKAHEGTKQATHRDEGSHQGRHEHDSHHHGESGTSVGVGVSVDLSGIGRRTAEPDPFAAGGNPPRTTEHREEKTVKKSTNTAKTDPFAYVHLTGADAKEQNSPPGPINVDNDRPPAQPVVNQNDAVPAGGQNRGGNDSSGSAAGFDDGLPPPKLTEKDCARLRNRLMALVASYTKALQRLNKADYELYSLEQEAWEANNKLSEGYEDQSIGLIDEGRDEWEHINKDWSPAVRQYQTDFDAASKAHDDLVRERAAFQRMCPGLTPPEIPDLPQKRDKFDQPGEYGRD